MEDKTFAFHTLVPYTTRPMRSTEVNGRDYFFTDEAGLSRLQDAGRVIELRSYQTVHGIWNYFTVDDGQVDLARIAICWWGHWNPTGKSRLTTVWNR